MKGVQRAPCRGCSSTTKRVSVGVHCRSAISDNRQFIDIYSSCSRADGKALTLAGRTPFGCYLLAMPLRNRSRYPTTYQSSVVPSQVGRLSQNRHCDARRQQGDVLCFPLAASIDLLPSPASQGVVVRPAVFDLLLNEFLLDGVFQSRGPRLPAIIWRWGTGEDKCGVDRRRSQVHVCYVMRA